MEVSRQFTSLSPFELQLACLCLAQLCRLPEIHSIASGDRCRRSDLQGLWRRLAESAQTLQLASQETQLPADLQFQSIFHRNEWAMYSWSPSHKLVNPQVSAESIEDTEWGYPQVSCILRFWNTWLPADLVYLCIIHPSRYNKKRFASSLQAKWVARTASQRNQASMFLKAQGTFWAILSWPACLPATKSSIEMTCSIDCCAWRVSALLCHAE